MVKLASARGTRAYGPGESKDILEDINAFGYLVAAVLLTAGSVLLLPGYSAAAGLWLILIGLVFIFLVNLHDLYANLAAVNFDFSLIGLDWQLAAIEIAAPIVQAIGAIVYFVGAFLLLQIARGDYEESTAGSVSVHTYRLLIAAPALWLLGSIQNSFQLYSDTELEVQAYQRGVTLPFVSGSLLLLLSGIVNVMSWPLVALHTAQMFAATLAIAGFALFLVAGVVNAVRVIKIQHTEQAGGHLEKLRGGAQEAVAQSEEEAGIYAPVPKDDHYTEIESGQGQRKNPYKENVVPAARMSER
ncbi:unnamed protein product [Calypogeia fissa]